MKKAILLSGGIDSAALAYWKRPQVAINVNYGQKAGLAERNASRSIAKALNIEFKCIDVDCSLLGSGDLLRAEPLDIAPVTEWWPYRNQLLVTLAGMLCINSNVNELMVGAVSSDKRISDGKLRFYELIDQLTSFQEGELRVTAPAIKYQSERLIQISKVPVSILGWTHSCHVDNVPCGNCNGCKKHIQIKNNLQLI